MQITPTLIEQSLNPHKLEMIKTDGRYNHLVGLRIKGDNIKQEINIKLSEVKIPFREGK